MTLYKKAHDLDPPFPEATFKQAAKAIAAIGKFLYAQGWSPATSSNYSLRLNDGCCAITQSGKDKSLLSEHDIMAVALDGLPLTAGKPSAETGLHLAIYRSLPQTGAILHTHSPAATVLTRLLMHCDTLYLRDYELLKAFNGIDTHNTELHIPIFENTQDIRVLAEQTALYFKTSTQPVCYAYLIRGHGLYTWGRDMSEAKRHIEALEFMMQCELQQLTYQKMRGKDNE